ncbi:MAG: DUF2520 domain-containing protein [Alicyclobacillus macrosporangiidus]|uniref:Rossmann-like and DUF2520 domain-containing protein n=1 Tax=Alicyclobacillus macrosporangiidus TaxID=392015 RepID=UPI0026F0A255|nr:Rossmann-like and DUF2520 domain-containing protein [Alicyclobacillus macrosporangiidus]MCL6599416.1 DUF2520 domain-containing protein [Alicyclobacillus macrosporangiidus]
MSQIIVVGPGRVGTGLALTLTTAGHRVLAAIHRNPDSTSGHRFESLLGVPAISWAAAETYVRRADAILIAVPDREVADLAERLAASGWLDAHHVVIQTAGSLSSDCLSAVSPSDAARLTLHPLQTLSDPLSAPTLLRGATCTLDGDDRAVALGTTWVLDWGGVPVRIRPEQRPAYHAAAVLASNALIALAASAVEIAERTGLPDGLAALLPLMRGAIANLEGQGLPDALTGPVERGDLLTVQSHLNALREIADDGVVRRVYAVLGLATVNVARHKGTLSEDEVQALQAIFHACLGGM